MVRSRALRLSLATLLISSTAHAQFAPVAPLPFGPGPKPASLPYTNFLQLFGGLTGAPAVTNGGATYVTNESVTLATTGGTCSQPPIVTVTAAAGVVSSVAVTTPGVCSVIPPAPLTQASTTGSGTGLTLTPSAAQWGGTWTAITSQAMVELTGAGGGSGALSGGGAATSAGASSGEVKSALMTFTPGASISYVIGQPGIGGASGGANAGTSGGTTTFNGLSVSGGQRSVGSATTNGAVPNPPVITGLAPTAATQVLAASLQAPTAGAGGVGGSGGGGPVGTGGSGRSNNTGAACTDYGAGAAGSGDTGSVAHAGTNGCSGGIWLRW